MKKTWIVAMLVSLLLPPAAPAAPVTSVPRSEILKQVESSLLVKGTIETNADGSVDTLSIDKPEKFPPGLLDLVQRQVKGWKFEPVLVDGRAMRARSSMSLRLVAKKLDDEAVSVTIRNANFDGQTPKDGEWLVSLKLPPPRYPQMVARSGASGTAYVVVRVGKEGTVIDSMVEQVNLRTIGSAKEMSAWRTALANAALKGARNWTFIPPVRGELADDGEWSARVPVDFTMSDRPVFVYGKWDLYIPGPRQRIPWYEHEDRPGFSPDALAEGGVYMMGQSTGPKLLTSLEGG